MADKKQKNDISKLSFEEAIKELTSIVSKIEQGQILCRIALSNMKGGWP